MIYYKHISEDDPPPKSHKLIYNKHKNNEDFTKKIKTSQAYGIKQNNFDESFEKYHENPQVEYEDQISFENDEEDPPKYPKLLNAFNGKVIDFPSKKIKFVKGNVKNHGTDKDFLKAMKHFYAYGGKSNFIEQKPVKVSFTNDNQLTQLTDENFPEHPLIIFNGKTSKFPSSSKIFFAKNQNLDENFPPNMLKQFHNYKSKASKQKSMKFSGKFSPDSRHEHRLNGY